MHGQITGYQKWKMFQSAPLTDVRGDREQRKQKKAERIVSIRSPHGCKGRFVCVILSLSQEKSFNPLPSRM